MCFCIFSCTSDEIPDEILISENSKKFGHAICEYFQLEEDFQKSCWEAVRGQLDERTKDLVEEERKRFILDVVHALIETDCADEYLDELDLNQLMDEGVQEAWNSFAFTDAFFDLMRIRR